jgi:hypothetical protein
LNSDFRHNFLQIPNRRLSIPSLFLSFPQYSVISNPIISIDSFSSLIRQKSNGQTRNSFPLNVLLQ